MSSSATDKESVRTMRREMCRLRELLTDLLNRSSGNSATEQELADLRTYVASLRGNLKSVGLTNAGESNAIIRSLRDRLNADTPFLEAEAKKMATSGTAKLDKLPKEYAAIVGNIIRLFHEMMKDSKPYRTPLERWEQAKQKVDEDNETNNLDAIDANTLPVVQMAVFCLAASANREWRRQVQHDATR
jgi:hypothetical protein